MKTFILGAGLSGLSTAYFLQKDIPEFDFSTKTRYSKIYLHYSFASANMKLQNYLKENYILESDIKDVQMKIYVHK